MTRHRAGADLESGPTRCGTSGCRSSGRRWSCAERPTSAKAGDEAIIHADGSIEGFVGGTCAETTVRAQSLMLLDSKEPLLLRITPTPRSRRSRRHRPRRHADRAQPVPVRRHPGDLPGPGGPAAAGAGARRRADRQRAVAGRPGELDYRVHAASTGRRSAAPLAVVVASHGRDEVDVLAAALDAGVPYIGLVASRTPRRRRAGRAREARPTWRGSRPAGCTARPGWTSARRTACGDRAVDPGRGGASPAALRGDQAARQRHGRRYRRAEPRGDGRAVTAIDPVCGMTVAAVESSLHLDHDGEPVYFCGAGCLRAFSANPSVRCREPVPVERPVMASTT